MPTLPPIVNDLQHPSTMPVTIPSSDVRSLLTDSILSFSPLATLVGVDAVRSLAHRSTNQRQSLAMSVAPIGTLGVMATICKASNLSPLKDMLGVSEQNIYNAAREVGCGVAIGSALPRMDQAGNLISDLKEEDYSQAAHAIVRIEWRTGIKQQHLDFGSLRWIAENFAGATVSGRIRWNMQSKDALEEIVSRVQEILRRSSHGFAIDAFEAIHQLDGGQGVAELSWPAPAMPLETQPLYVVIYLLVFLVAFSVILVLPAPRHCALPVMGFGLSVIGHWGTRFAVNRQRITLSVSIPKMRSGAWNSWMLVDKPRFPTILARRSFFSSAKWLSFTYICGLKSPKERITLSQHHEFKQLHTSPVLTILSLTILCTGFIVFYLGIKSSNLKLVVLLLVTYILANLSKGWIARHANKSYHTRLNNSGHPRVDKPYSSREQVVFLTEEQASPHNARERVNVVELGAGVVMPGNTHPSLTATEEPSQFPDAFPLYCKFQARDRKGIDLFCFSSPHEWIIAARIIIRTIKPFLASSPSPIEKPESLLRIPIYSWHPRANGQRRGHLLMAIDNIKPRELFWNVGMEIAMIVLGNYQSPRLCSEHKAAMNRSLLGSVVYSCTSLLLSEFARGGDVQPVAKQQGVQSLMHSIEEAADALSNPRQDIPSIVPTLLAAANAAIAASVPRPTAPQGEVLEISNKDAELSRLAGLRSKKLRDLDNLLDKLTAYIDVITNDRWTSLPPFKPRWMEDLDECDTFRNVTWDQPLDVHQPSQAKRFVPPDQLEEDNSIFEQVDLPQQRASFNALLLQELRGLEAYQNSGLMPHHTKLLVPAQRKWLEKLLAFQRAIQSSSHPVPHQHDIHAPVIDSHFDEQSQQLWRLYRSPRLRQLQHLQDLQTFLRSLESDSQDAYPPFQKQVAIAIQWADRATTFFAQAPLLPWFTKEDRGFPKPPKYVVSALLPPMILGANTAGCLLLYFASNTHKSEHIIKAILITGGVSLIAVILAFVFFLRYDSVHLKLAYTLWCKTRRSHEGQGRKQAAGVVLTAGQAIRCLIRELELLRIGVLKRRAPLRVALLEERPGDWGQFKAEYEQENPGYAGT